MQSKTIPYYRKVRCARNQQSFTHTSDITGSEWDIVLNDDYDITACFLNGKKVVVSKALENLLFSYFKKHNYL